MLDGYEVRAVYNPMMHALDVYLVKRLPGGGRVVLDGMSAAFTEKVLEEYAVQGEVRPTFQFDMATVQAFADAFEKQGIRTDTDAKLRGELEATKRHLEDLRLMLKLQAAED